MSIQAYKYINLNDGKILLKKINIQDTEYKITNKPNGDKILEKINKNQPDIDKTKQVNTIMNYISKFIENGNKILNDGNNILIKTQTNFTTLKLIFKDIKNIYVK
jgi:hypothetical protein